MQYREKRKDTATQIREASRLLAIAKMKGVPLIINDRMDVALAIGADGVHLGQDDTDIPTARKILGHDKLIGATISSVEEGMKAIQDGADYLGIGTLFATATKEDTKVILGLQGTRAILAEMEKMIGSSDAYKPVVAIGGINASNIQRIMYQSRSTNYKLNGVAVVSAIMAAEKPTEAVQELRTLMNTPPVTESNPTEGGLEGMLKKVPVLVSAVDTQGPLCHNMTNLVVQNFAANVALAIGASPIMANYGKEAEDLSALGGALLVNMGSVTPDAIANYLVAMGQYNLNDSPIVFDPVGAGGTQIRKEAVKAILNGAYIDVIKGNEREISVVMGDIEGQQKGVDSGPSSTSADEKAVSVKTLAGRERNIVVMTGVVDYLSDGTRTFSVHNGHSYLSAITGSGCVLGTMIAAYLAVASDKLLGAMVALLVFEIAAERAAVRSDVRGPGTFVPALIDELYLIIQETRQGNMEWLQKAKVREVTNLSGVVPQ